jgi:hypothetical protein
MVAPCAINGVLVADHLHRAGHDFHHNGLAIGAQIRICFKETLP